MYGLPSANSLYSLWRIVVAFFDHCINLVTVSLLVFWFFYDLTFLSRLNSTKCIELNVDGVFVPCRRLQST